MTDRTLLVTKHAWKRAFDRGIDPQLFKQITQAQTYQLRPNGGFRWINPEIRRPVRRDNCTHFETPVVVTSGSDGTITVLTTYWKTLKPANGCKGCQKRRKIKKANSRKKRRIATIRAHMAA